MFCRMCNVVCGSELVVSWLLLVGGVMVLVLLNRMCMGVVSVCRLVGVSVLMLLGVIRNIVCMLGIV